jgi:phospholipase D-like protein
MPVTSFLSNEKIWETIKNKIGRAHHVDAAIAYVGIGGAKMIPLQKGHRLVVDLSMPTVRAGSTNPYEIEKLVTRGVQVFTRRNLHAKLLIIDNTVIAGSANVSKSSKDTLDEAAILTDIPVALRRARDFFERLCTEPLRPEYLNECKLQYKPPRTGRKKGVSSESTKRVKHAKLWIVGLREYSVPESEWKRYEEGEQKAERLVKDKARSQTANFHWLSKPKMADELETGDWIIQIVTYKDKTILVYPPGQFLFMDSYVRNRETGAKRYVFHMEVPKRGQTLTWGQFKQKVKSLANLLKLQTPRTVAVRDVDNADGLLGLWSPAGRVVK